MIDAEGYKKALGITSDIKPGGQELLLGEIVGAFVGAGVSRVFLPYPTPALCIALSRAGLDVIINGASHWDGLYFGTPTIVEDQCLFPSPDGLDWDMDRERVVVRSLCRLAEVKKAKLIVSGLGSGDISTDERLEDMGPGSVVIAAKVFIGFDDYVLARRLT